MTGLIKKTCIACPRGCELEITVADGEVTVTGHKCDRGRVYGQQEAIEPMRILTTTVRTTSEARPRLPVRTAGEVPLRRIPELLAAIDSVTVSPGIKCGDPVVRNLVGSGTDLIATDDL